MIEKTHYDVLKVSPDAPLEVITASYRALAKLHHPDANRTRVRSEVDMQRLNAAWEVLGNPERRRLYDDDLKRAQRQRPVENRQPAAGPPSSGRPLRPRGLQPRTRHEEEPMTGDERKRRRIINRLILTGGLLVLVVVGYRVMKIDGYGLIGFIIMMCALFTIGNLADLDR